MAALRVGVKGIERNYALDKPVVSCNTSLEDCCLMYKPIVVLSVLLASLAASYGQSSLASPYIVAKGKFIGRATSIPMTTIFTPARTGLYRVSMYMTVTTADPSSSYCWSPLLQWTDDGSTPEIGSFLSTCGSSVGPAYSGNTIGAVNIIEAKSGTPVSFEILKQDNSVISFYYVVEALGSVP